MPKAALLDLLNTLRELLGKAHVLTDGDLSAYEQDWRKRTRGKALAVVRPGNTQQVADIVKACAKAGVSIVPPRRQHRSSGRRYSRRHRHTDSAELAAHERHSHRGCRQSDHHRGGWLHLAKFATNS